MFRWCVLFSHPSDFTPVCTTELGRIAVHKDHFAKRNVKLLAHSVDDIKSHCDWVNVSFMFSFLRWAFSVHYYSLFKISSCVIKSIWIQLNDWFRLTQFQSICAEHCCCAIELEHWTLNMHWTCFSHNNSFWIQ